MRSLALVLLLPSLAWADLPEVDENFVAPSHDPLPKHPGPQKPEPRVLDVPEKIAVRGGSSSEDVRFYVLRQRYHLTECYARALATSPKLTGSFTAQFLIMPNGSVKHVHVLDSTLKSPALEQCLEGAVGQIHFRLDDHAMLTVSYPFVLKVE